VLRKYFCIKRHVFVFCLSIGHNDRALCSCGIRIPSARNDCPAFDKDKCLELMFGDVGQARTNVAMLLLLIATTLTHTCTKLTVGCSAICPPLFVKVCFNFETIILQYRFKFVSVVTAFRFFVRKLSCEIFYRCQN